jgi:hypothetical protein
MNLRKLTILSLFIYCALFAATGFSQGIQRTFIFDGCTGYKEGTRSEPTKWSHCCFAHDLRYWAGGTQEQRVNADLKIKKCVKETGAELHATIMLLGIRAGGLSPIKIRGKQWGNAWSNKIRNKTLNVDEIDQLNMSLINHTSLSINEIQEFINSLKNDLIP